MSPRVFLALATGALAGVPPASGQALTSVPAHPLVEAAPSAVPSTIAAAGPGERECADGQEFAQNTVTSAYGNGDTITSAGGAQELGQSFLAPCSGFLKAVRIVYQPDEGTAGQTAIVDISLFAGEGTGGTLLASDTYSFVGPAENAAYYLTGRFDVQVSDSAPYTFFVDATEYNFYVHGASPGPYVEGMAYGSTSGSAAGARAVSSIDLRFALTFAPPLATAGDDGPTGSALSLDPVRPNPVTGAARIPFALATPAHVRVEVLDLLGRPVAVLADRGFGVGRHAVGLDAGALPHGNYVVRLTTPAGTASRLLAVAR